MAGSIPRLSKNKGTNVPISPAIIITATSDTEMANALVTSPLYNQTKRNRKTARMIPLSVANNISLINLLLTLPLRSSLARP